MLRRLFTLLSALSLLLCVATVVVWVRSYWVLDNVERWSPRGAISITTSRGHVSVKWAGMEFPPLLEWSQQSPKDLPQSFRVRVLSPEDVNVQWGGFAFWRGDRGVGWFWELVLPLWVTFLLSGLLPSLRVAAAIRRAKQRRESLCPTCGYDLRATPGRCPECGAVPEGVKA